MSALTIIGRGPSWKECPFVTEELWGTATCLLEDGLSEKKFTKVFYFDGETYKDNPGSLAIARERRIPIISRFSERDEIYPLREVIRDCRSSYFLTTISYMLAYAIHLKYSKIFLYGIDQGPSWELQQGKPHVCYWVGFANGRGIEVIMGRGSLRWAYNVGKKPEAEAIEIPEKDRLGSVLCESVLS